MLQNAPPANESPANESPKAPTNAQLITAADTLAERMLAANGIHFTCEFDPCFSRHSDNGNSLTVERSVTFTQLPTNGVRKGSIQHVDNATTVVYDADEKFVRISTTEAALQAMIAEQTNPLSQLEQIKAERTALDAKEAQVLTEISTIGLSIVQKMVQTMHPDLVFNPTINRVSLVGSSAVRLDFNTIEVPNEFPDLIENASLALYIYTCIERPSATTKKIIGLATISNEAFSALASKQVTPVTAVQS